MRARLLLVVLAAAAAAVIAVGVGVGGGGGGSTSSVVWDVAWSPDGSQLAVAWGSLGIYRVSVEGGRLLDLTPGFARAFDPAWSPDGRRIAFDVPSNDAAGDGDLELMAADGSGQHRLARDANEPAWSPDGRTIVVWATEGDYRDHLKLLTPGGRLIRELSFPFHALRFPFWSRDGSGSSSTRTAATVPSTPSGRTATICTSFVGATRAPGCHGRRRHTASSLASPTAK